MESESINSEAFSKKREKVSGKIDESSDKTIFLENWKDILTYMSFTTTTFVEEEDAIYYFGKLNDAETSQQLNIGDLMRHLTALVTRKAPLQHSRNDDIKSDWNAVEDSLKSDRPKDMVPAFLSSWLTSQGKRQSDRKVYTALKKHAEEKYKNGNSWEKDEFYSWINKLRKASELFREICFAEIGDEYHLNMKCIDSLAKQHRPLFLADLAFQRHGLKDQMKKLINIFEFMTIKGVEIPSSCGIDGITSQDRYAWIDWCKKIYEESDEFETQMNVNDANQLLDGLQVKFFKNVIVFGRRQLRMN